MSSLPTATQPILLKKIYLSAMSEIGSSDTAAKLMMLHQDALEKTPIVKEYYQIFY